MPKQRPTGDSSIPQHDASDLTEVAIVNQKTVESMVDLHQKMFRESLRFQAELLDFARRRIGADIETQERLSKCNSVDSAARVMSEFCSDAMRDYAEEAAGLVQRGLSIAALATGREAEGEGPPPAKQD